MGAYIHEGETIPASDRIHRVIANVEALRAIFRINERAQFEWIVSHGSLREAYDKGDPGHMQWLWDIGPLAYLLRNRFYIGEVVYRGEITSLRLNLRFNKNMVRFPTLEAHEGTRNRDEVLLNGLQP
jgi:hypothetical protein